MATNGVILGTGRAVMLGAILPRNTIEGERFTLYTLPDGRKKLVPSLGFHLAPSKGEAARPPKTTWREKALASVAQALGNLDQGDCVIASKLHMLALWIANKTGSPLLSSDQEALSIYHQLCGPGDNGCVITDVLDAMKAGHFMVGGQPHVIDGYVSLDTGRQDLVETAAWLFGGATALGINLPGSWAQAVRGNDFLWDDTNDRPVGGHDVPILDFDERGVQVATWGYWGTISWRALANRNIVEQALLVLGPDWYKQGNLSPSGLDVDALKRDLDAIGNGTIPPDPSPGPGPGPGPGPAPNPLACLATGFREFMACLSSGRFEGHAEGRVRPTSSAGHDTSVGAAAASPIQCAQAAAWTTLLCILGQLHNPGRKAGCGCQEAKH